MMQTTTIFTAATTLILVMDPLGNVPVFVSMLKSVDPNRRAKIIFRESCIALLVLMIFLFTGKQILHGLQVSMPALSIAGGIILFLIALKMIFPPDHSTEVVKQRSEPFIVPLAIPLLAGPSTMAVVMLFASREPDSLGNLSLALIIAWLICTGILLLSTRISKLLGERALTALERLMGMILTTLAVQMFLTGAHRFFN